MLVFDAEEGPHAAAHNLEHTHHQHQEIVLKTQPCSIDAADSAHTQGFRSAIDRAAKASKS
jgi:hypothetical protein